MPKKLKRMLAVIAEQRGKPDDGVFTLRGFTIAQLDQVAEFVKSFSGRPPAADAVDRQTDIEALALRLAKVEDHLAELEAPKGVIDNVQDSANRAHQRLSELEQYVWKAEPGFPTGAATTAEDALAQVEEPAEAAAALPKRGDRVRLERVKSAGGFSVRDGWHDVVGQRDMDTVPQFQIAEPRAGGGADLYWINAGHPGVEEVRRG